MAWLYTILYYYLPVGPYGLAPAVDMAKAGKSYKV